jgi:hypothetical protein
LDGQFKVSDQPIWLKDKVDGLTTATATIMGKATRWLPVLYFSAVSRNAWSVGKQQVEKIAYDLGGVAHIVAEPDRPFSFKLRDVSEAKNPYGGAVALILPNQGVVKRFHLGWQNQNSDELLTAIKRATVGLRGRMPSIGWDWTELQEQALRAHRIREKNRLTTEENESLYQEEIENLLDRIQQLETIIKASSVQSDEDSSFNDIPLGNLIKKIGPEIYSGEISDRIRLAARISMNVSDSIGLDKRSKAVLTKILEKVPASSSLSAIRQDLERATKDPKKMAGELTSLLTRHGYTLKSDNKHVKLEPLDGFGGLETLTIAKTPSDHRGLRNTRGQVERALGLTKLGEESAN